MTPILLYSQVALQDAPAGSALAADLTRIVAAAHRARSLVTGILTFSREMDLQQAAVFALRPTIEEALGLLRAIVPANIEITFEAQPDEVPVVGDPSLLHQVVINLCTNAYQAMSPSGGRIALKLGAVRNPAKSQVNPGHYVLLEVSDTGHGMDESVLAHIFDPFFTTRDVGEGTGLGLSIVHGIITSMGGVITVESAVGTGTMVQIYLPAAAGRFATLQPMVEDAMAVFSQTVSLDQAGNPGGATRIVRQGRGRVLMNGIRDTIQALLRDDEARAGRLDARAPA